MVKNHNCIKFPSEESIEKWSPVELRVSLKVLRSNSETDSKISVKNILKYFRNLQNMVIKVL